MLLSKQPSFIEVYNDLNGDVVNFFRAFYRKQPADLFAAIDLTPYSRQEYTEAQEMTGDDVERGRKFYVWAWQGRGRAGVPEPGGWRFMTRATRGTTPAQDWCNNQHLWAIAQRLKRVQIECDDALKVIARYDSPTTLFYVDPPYVQSTRGSRWAFTAYAHEMDDAAHGRLAELLHRVEGSVIVSGYPSPLYERFYGDRVRVECEKFQGESGAATEVLWMCVRPPLPTLFDLYGRKDAEVTA